MTQDEIIEMARQAEFVNLDLCSSELERFAKLVAQHEREACAKLFDERDKDIGWYDPGEPAEIIRARGRDAP
jgi:CRISPR/Cas system-associated protein Csm6